MARFSLRSALARIRSTLVTLYKNYRSLKVWLQVVIAVVLVGAVFGLVSLLISLFSPKAAEDTTYPTVTLAPVAELSGGSTSVGVIGSVRSITEASILAQSGGTVTGVHASLGSSVPAGFVIAELDNASQRAAVLQAEGSYDAAVAGRSGASPTDISASARNTYRTAFSSLDTLLRTDVDTFFGLPSPIGPTYLIGSTPFDITYFPQKRQAITVAMNAWRTHLASADSSDPAALLSEAETDTRMVSSLLTDMSVASTRNGTDATAAQLTALAAARAGVDGLASSITAAKLSYQGQGTSATAGADANVKIALGALRGAQANLEKTLVRAPIGGQINFLPIRTGDYVSPLQRVATVAQNGALEIVTYVSEDNRSLLSVGTKVKIEKLFSGTVTSISPALDPVTKQIEVHIAVAEGSHLENGQSVQISLPGAAPVVAATSTGPILLPLTAVKLTPAARVVFSIGTDGRLVSHAVDIGDVRGDRIEVLTTLPGDLRIVTDARGLSDGQKVTVATTP